MSNFAWINGDSWEQPISTLLLLMVRRNGFLQKLQDTRNNIFGIVVPKQMVIGARRIPRYFFVG